jgi:uncharacterized membrane protein YbhN (UPF0104 family)
MDSLRSFADAVSAFIDHLTNIALEAMALALLFEIANLVLRSRAWLNILRAAYPNARIRWRDVLGAYLAGAGINAILPVRGGDLVRIYAARQRIEGGTFPTVASSTIAETVFDFVVGAVLLAWAYLSGDLPLQPRAPELPAFEWGWFGAHPRITLAIAAVAAAVLVWTARRLRRFWAHVRQGVVILRTPRDFLTKVVLYQALGWLCRVGTAYELLEAFHVHATIRNALLTMVIGSVATMLPLTPGGAGAQQAMLAIVLAGAASRSQLLAYSIGAQVATTGIRVVLGLAAMFLLFGHIDPRRLRRAARSDQASAAPRGSPR